MSADDGRTMRLDSLERDAHEPILGRLRTHGWDAAIERRGSDADYVIITATRAGATQGDQDHYPVIIGAFLDIAERVLPEEFLTSITGQSTRGVQTGARW